ncbi:Ras-related protein RABH1b [Zea mays]|uniref:Ras-related protein RABH1b n=1 Tax=Zea mays TaxID=4577 RepID=A0A1D6J0K9_MAIZE|nr:Ras-related protein RABH1b [Zea mays]
MEGDPACGLALADEEAECSSWDSDDEYQKFIQNMNPPRVTIDNTSCPSAIVIHGKCPPTKEKPKHRSMVLCSWRPVQKLGSTSSPYSARSLDPF